MTRGMKRAAGEKQLEGPSQQKLKSEVNPPASTRRTRSKITQRIRNMFTRRNRKGSKGGKNRHRITLKKKRNHKKDKIQMKSKHKKSNKKITMK